LLKFKLLFIFCWVNGWINALLRMLPMLMETELSEAVDGCFLLIDAQEKNEYYIYYLLS